MKISLFPSRKGVELADIREARTYLRNLATALELSLQGEMLLFPDDVDLIGDVVDLLQRVEQQLEGRRG